MLQKLGFLPGFNKQVTLQVQSLNGQAARMYVLGMVRLKK